MKKMVVGMVVAVVMVAASVAVVKTQCDGDCNPSLPRFYVSAGNPLDTAGRSVFIVRDRVRGLCTQVIETPNGVAAFPAGC